jgi:hypothetical protein
MSSFANKGLRQTVLLKNKETKKHIEAFYNIIGEIDNISNQLDKSIEYTEENINEYVNPILGRDLDNMEMFLLLGKLNVVNNETKNNN